MITLIFVFSSKTTQSIFYYLLTNNLMKEAEKVCRCRSFLYLADT